MHDSKNWNALVTEFGRSIGLPEMSIGDIGLCRVELDDCTAIDFETDANGNLHLYCVMPAVPSDSRAALNVAMLQANYVGHRESVKACFGIDPVNGEAVLHLALPDSAGESLEVFSKLVQDFSAIANLWCQKIRDNDTEAASADSSAMPSSYA